MQCNIKSFLILHTFTCMYFICILNALCFDILFDFLPRVTIIFVSIHSCKVVFCFFYKLHRHNGITSMKLTFIIEH